MGGMFSEGEKRGGKAIWSNKSATEMHSVINKFADSCTCNSISVISRQRVNGYKGAIKQF